MRLYSAQDFPTSGCHKETTRTTHSDNGRSKATKINLHGTGVYLYYEILTKFYFSLSFASIILVLLHTYNYLHTVAKPVFIRHCTLERR